MKPGLVAYHEDKIFRLGAEADDTIDEYDIAGNSWIPVAGQSIPFSPTANFQVVQVDKTRAWIKNWDDLAQFDMDTKTIRTDVNIPAAPIKRALCGVHFASGPISFFVFQSTGPSRSGWAAARVFLFIHISHPTDSH